MDFLLNSTILRRGRVPVVATVLNEFGLVDFGDGNTTQYFDIPHDAILDLPAGSWAIGFWARIDDNTGENYQYALSSGGFNVTSSVNIYLVEASEATNPNKWALVIKDDADVTTNVQASTTAPGADGVTRLIVVQSTGTTVEMWFAEAGETATKEIDAAVDLGAITPAVNWNFGRRTDGNTDRFFEELAGGLFWANRNLTQAEIEQIASDKSPEDALGVDLVEYWQFNNGQEDETGTEAGTVATFVAEIGFEGFGANATGAGDTPSATYTVTRTDDDETTPVTGMFRWAVEQANANSPNTSLIAFDLSDGAIITLDSIVTLSANNVTLDGSTADGRFLIRREPNVSAGGAFRITSNNFIMKHIRIHRELAESGPTMTSEKCMDLIGATNGYITHCVFAWGDDENVTPWTNRSNITFDYCMIYEGFVHGHQNETTDSRAFLSLIANSTDTNQNARTCFIRCVFAHGTNGRMPWRVRDSQTEFINCIAYNWEHRGLFGGEWNGYSADIEGNCKGCIWLAGPDNEDDAHEPMQVKRAAVYGEDLVWQKTDLSITTTVSDILGLDGPNVGSISGAEFDFNPAVPVTHIAATDLWAHLKPRVGAIEPLRSDSDQRIIDQIDAVLATAYGGQGGAMPGTSQLVDMAFEDDLLFHENDKASRWAYAGGNRADALQGP